MSVYHYSNRIREAIKTLNPSARQIDIYQFELPARARNAMKWAGIKTLDDILKMTDGEVYQLPNFGRKSINDLLRVIEELEKTHGKVEQDEILIEGAPLSDHPSYNDDPVIKSILAFIPINLPNWIGLYLENYPEHMEHFDKLNIKNEYIYIIERKKLPEEVRNSADNFRFETFLPHIDKRNHLYLLAIAPDWLLNTKISKAQCSVRLENTMRNEGLIKFSDLLNVSQENLLKVANFGRKSFTELPEAIVKCYNNGCLANLDNSQTLKDCFLKALEDLLNEKQRYVLKKRSGISGRTETLGEIGTQLDLTRERIRQIELKAIRIIKAKVFWIDILDAKLQNFLKNNEGYAYVDKIIQADSWFNGFEGDTGLLVWIAKEFCRQRLH